MAAVFVRLDQASLKYSHSFTSGICKNQNWKDEEKIYFKQKSNRTLKKYDYKRIN